jgi:hypothetical protein
LHRQSSAQNLAQNEHDKVEGRCERGGGVAAVPLAPQIALSLARLVFLNVPGSLATDFDIAGANRPLPVFYHVRYLFSTAFGTIGEAYDHGWRVTVRCA